MVTFCEKTELCDLAKMAAIDEMAESCSTVWQKVAFDAWFDSQIENCPNEYDPMIWEVFLNRIRRGIKKKYPYYNPEQLFELLTETEKARILTEVIEKNEDCSRARINN